MVGWAVPTAGIVEGGMVGTAHPTFAPKQYNVVGIGTRFDVPLDSSHE